MGLYRRPRSPYWWAYYYNSDGQRVRESTRKTDRRAAQVWLAAQEVQSAREIAGGPRLRRIGLTDAVAEFLDEHVPPMWSKGWHDTVTSWWRSTLLPELGHDSDVAAVSREAVAQLRQDALAEYTAATVNRLTACGSAFFKWAMARQYATANPFAGHRHLREPKTPPPALSEAAINRFLRALPPEWRRRATVAVDTALRASELGRLTWGDLKAGCLHVTCTYAHGSTKTGRMRIVPLSARALRAIRAQPAHGMYIFGPHTRGQPYRRALAQAQAAARTGPFRWHDLRHYAITRLAEHLDPFALMEMVGWTSLAMASRYVHPRLAPMKRAVARLG